MRYTVGFNSFIDPSTSHCLAKGPKISVILKLSKKCIASNTQDTLQHKRPESHTFAQVIQEGITRKISIWTVLSDRENPKIRVMIYNGEN